MRISEPVKIDKARELYRVGICDWSPSFVIFSRLQQQLCYLVSKDDNMRDAAGHETTRRALDRVDEGIGEAERGTFNMITGI